MPTAGLDAAFRAFAREVAARSPLYARLSAGIAEHPEVLALLDDAPEAQRRPVLLLAAIHDLVLRDPTQPLARWYPDLSTDPPAADPVPAVVQLCRERGEEVRRLCATRTTQTNEVGRCAYLLPALGLLAGELGELALVDMGCSAGLNLLVDRYRYDYGPLGTLGPDGAHNAPLLSCGTRGAVPLPRSLPRISARMGVDRAPVDVHDDEATRWLRACIWADQTDRMRRLDAAIEIARSEHLELRVGDAVADVAATTAAAARRGHPVVMTSWVLTYVSGAERRAFVAELDELGCATDLSWVVAESPALTPELPVPPSPDPSVPDDRTVITLVTWRAGRRDVRRLGIAHPHGAWLHWGR